MNHLLVRSTKGDLFLGEYNGKIYLPDAAHLTTFAAGNWLLGAALLDDEDLPRKALELLDSSWRAHDYSPCVFTRLRDAEHMCSRSHRLGLGPDEYSIVPEKTSYAGSRRYRKQAEKLGFYSTNSG